MMWRRGARVPILVPSAVVQENVVASQAARAESQNSEEAEAALEAFRAHQASKRRGADASAAPPPPPAPAPDGSTDRARHLTAQFPAVFNRLTEAALGVARGTSQAFAEAVTAQSEKIRSQTSSQLVQQFTFSEPEARFVTTALAPNIRNLAVAQLLGDAARAPGAPSPRALTHEELVAELARFELGEVDDIRAEARNRIVARAAAPDAMPS